MGLRIKNYGWLLKNPIFRVELPKMSGFELPKMGGFELPKMGGFDSFQV